MRMAVGAGEENDLDALSDSDDVASEASLERLYEAADEELNGVEGLRARWRSAERERDSWLTDVASSVRQWSHSRARTEEEMIRRLEASRASTPYAALAVGSMVDTQTVMMASALSDDEAVEPGGASAATGGPSAGEFSHSEDAGWLSPYARGGGTPHRRAPGTATEFSTSISSQRAVVRAAAATLDASGHPVPLSVLERALLPPVELPAAQCALRLPAPGAYLQSQSHNGMATLPTRGGRRGGSGKSRGTTTPRARAGGRRANKNVAQDDDEDDEDDDDAEDAEDA